MIRHLSAFLSLRSQPGAPVPFRRRRGSEDQEPCTGHGCRVGYVDTVTRRLASKERLHAAMAGAIDCDSGGVAGRR